MKPKLNFFAALVCTLLFFACDQTGKEDKMSTTSATDMLTRIDTLSNKKQIAAMLDSFNVAAANADYDRYFNYFTEDATFNGTDATENWDKKAFMVWAKKYFDKKTTWNFTSIQRNIYFGKNADIAWFDELLSTQMKICRGSGVVVKQNSEWKVQQYVLSMTIPNDLSNGIIKMKAPLEDSIINKLSADKTYRSH
jgi:outer membrane murein-binding lipoprotein Lpp